MNWPIPGPDPVIVTAPPWVLVASNAVIVAAGKPRSSLLPVTLNGILAELMDTFPITVWGYVSSFAVGPAVTLMVAVASDIPLALVIR